MSSKTATEATTTVIASPKVTNAVREYVVASNKAQAMFLLVAITVPSEAKRMGLTEQADIHKMVTLSWQAAYEMDKKTEAERKAFELRERPNVSKVITLSYPKTAKAKAEFDKCQEHNSKLSPNAAKHARIGVNRLLEVARGNMTFSQAIAVKQAKKRASGDNPLSTYDQFRNAITGLLDTFKVGSKERLSEDQAQKAFDEALAGWMKVRSASAASAK